jgi:hypothetical protein
MKQLEKTITIKYRLWRADKKRISPNQVSTLEETALDQIKDQMEQGFTSGRLDTTLSFKSREYEFNGHWETSTT